MAKRTQADKRHRPPADSPREARQQAPPPAKSGSPKWYDVPPEKHGLLLTVSICLVLLWLGWLVWLAITVLRG